MLSLKEIMPALTMDFSQNITRVGDHIYINPKKDHTSTFIWVILIINLDAWFRGYSR